MSTDTVVRARIDSDTKARATETLQAMGLSVSDAIRLLLLRVADEKRLPFTVQTPNATTARAVKELDEGRGKRFGSTRSCSGISTSEMPIRKSASDPAIRQRAHRNAGVTPPPAPGDQAVRLRHRQSAVSGQSDENSVVAAIAGGTAARSCAA